MSKEMGMLVVVGVCVLVLAIVLFKRRAEIILNFFVRTILGVIGIYFTNLLLANLGIEGAVGINPISILTVGSLGTGGFGLLYGILLYNML